MTEEQVTKVQDQHALWIDPVSHDGFCTACSAEGREPWVPWPCSVQDLVREVRRQRRMLRGHAALGPPCDCNPW